jgi:hypothetical protein
MPLILVILGMFCALLTPPADPCSLCSATKQVSCPTCSGRGRASIECQSCRGASRIPCVACKIPPSVMQALPTKPKRGQIPCPNPHCDKKGVVTWETGSTDACRLCEGRGVYKCPICSEGMAPCSPCASKGRTESTCGDCAGSGKLPCPGCSVKPKAPSCPFCRNSRKRACELCKPGATKAPDAGATVKCGACGGIGSKACEECRGLGRSPCASCGGTGKIRSVVVGSGSKAGKKTHESCQGTGWLKCDLCKSGRVDCGKCKAGNLSVKCSGCRDTKTIVCHGCLPASWSAFETCGRILHLASRFADAEAFYAKAMSLASGTIINENADDPTAKRLLDAWVSEARSRLEALIAAAEQKRPPPAPK